MALNTAPAPSPNFIAASLGKRLIRLRHENGTQAAEHFNDSLNAEMTVTEELGQ